MIVKLQGFTLPKFLKSTALNDTIEYRPRKHMDYIVSRYTPCRIGVSFHLSRFILSHLISTK